MEAAVAPMFRDGLHVLCDYIRVISDQSQLRRPREQDHWGKAYGQPLTVTGEQPWGLRRGEFLQGVEFG